MKNIDEFYRKLAEIHKIYCPNLRFGQFCNVIALDLKDIDLYEASENQILEALAIHKVRPQMTAVGRVLKELKYEITGYDEYHWFGTIDDVISYCIIAPHSGNDYKWLLRLNATATLDRWSVCDIQLAFDNVEDLINTIDDTKKITYLVLDYYISQAQETEE